MISLPDVNVLLALAWPNHQSHGVARDWFASARDRGWATTTVTELGFVRLSSNPAFTPEAVRPADAFALFERLCTVGDHRFLAAPTLLDAGFVEALPTVQGYRQVTDAHLLGLSLLHEAEFVTLDKRLVSLAPRGCTVRLI